MADPELIENFVAITGAPRHVAEHILEAHGWALEPSINFYLESGGIGHGNETASFDAMAASPAAPRRGPLPAAAAPRSSPLPIPLDDDEDDLGDDRALAASLGRHTAGRRRSDYFDEDWNPEGAEELADDDDDMSLASSDEDAAPRNRRRVRRNRPSGAAAADAELRELQRRFGVGSGGGAVPGDDDVEIVEDLPGGSGGGGSGSGGAGAEPAPDVDPADLPDDVDLEEQRMLLAALTGEAYRGRIPDFSTDPRYRPTTLSPGARARDALRREQNAAYEESLEADRRKAEEAERMEREAREAEEAAAAVAAAAEREAAEAAAALQRTLTAKEASLPPEPEAGESDTVQIVVRLPGGGRLGRRFRQGDPLSAVFDFVDVSSRGSELAPGSYNLVSQFPRRVFEDGGGATLAAANLAHKQEALFIEMK